MFPKTLFAGQCPSGHTRIRWRHHRSRRGTSAAVGRVGRMCFDGMQLRPMPSAEHRLLAGFNSTPQTHPHASSGSLTGVTWRIRHQLMALRTKRAMAASDAFRMPMLDGFAEKKVERTFPNSEMFLIVLAIFGCPMTVYTPQSKFCEGQFLHFKFFHYFVF